MNFTSLLLCLFVGLTISKAVSRLVVASFQRKLGIFKPFEKDTKDKQITRSPRDVALLFLLSRVELLSAITTSLLLLFVFQSFFAEGDSLDLGYFLILPTLFTVANIFFILFVAARSKQFFKYLLQSKL